MRPGRAHNGNFPIEFDGLQPERELLYSEKRIGSPNRLTIVVVALGAILTGAQPVSANPISYVETGVMSGTLNGKAFGNAAVTITTVGDTANITTVTINGFQYYKNVGTTTIQIAGVGTATFNGGDSFGALSEKLLPGTIEVGIMDWTIGASILHIVTPNPSFYDLSTATTFTAMSVSDHGVVLSTTLGNLVIRGTSGNATFTVTFPRRPRHPSI